MLCVEWVRGVPPSVNCASDCGREREKEVGICGIGLRIEEIYLIGELRLKMFDDCLVHSPNFPFPFVLCWFT